MGACAGLSESGSGFETWGMGLLAPAPDKKV